MQNKGTIIYVGGFELPDKNAAAQRVLSIAKILRELEYTVIFLSVDKTLKKGEDLCENKTQNFVYHAISYPKTNKEWFSYITSISSLKKVINKYDNIKFVIFYNYQSIAYIKAIRYCKKKGIKVIGDCTEWYDFKDGGFVFKTVKFLDVFLRMRIIQKRLDGLIVISEFLKKYYIKRKNIIKIPPLVDFDEKKWKQRAECSEKNVIKFVYSGNPGSNKDKLDRILSLLKNFEKIELELIGITKNEYLNLYTNGNILLDQFKGRIIFCGKVDHYENIKKISSADFFVFFRDINRVTKAGFPTKFVESYSCGTPIITNLTSDINEYLNKGVKVLIIDKEVSQQKLLDFINNCLKDSTHETNCSFEYHRYIEMVKVFMKKVE